MSKARDRHHIILFLRHHIIYSHFTVTERMHRLHILIQTLFDTDSGIYDILTRYLTKTDYYMFTLQAPKTDCRGIATCRHTELLRGSYWLLTQLLRPIISYSEPLPNTYDCAQL